MESGKSRGTIKAATENPRAGLRGVTVGIDESGVIRTRTREVDLLSDEAAAAIADELVQAAQRLRQGWRGRTVLH